MLKYLAFFLYLANFFIVAVFLFEEVSADQQRPCIKDSDCTEKAEFCEFALGECGKTESKGECIMIPEVCTMIFQPVCGCNNKTYSNKCAAQKDKVSILNDGECG